MKQILSFLISGIICISLVIPGQLTAGTLTTSGSSGDSLPKTEVRFKTTNAVLQKVYDTAEEKAKWNIVNNFGKYQVLVEGGGYNNVWLETQPMGGYMYAKRNMEAAMNNIRIFIDYQREDGRYPGMLHFTDGKTSAYYDHLPGTHLYEKDKIMAHYGWFQGYCFPMPAFEMYYWLGKDRKYLEQLYTSLEKFDEYLWKTRDSDQNGCLETWCICDTGEDACSRFNGAMWAWSYDYAPSSEAIRKLTEEEQKQVGITKDNLDKIDNFPTPMESMDIMSYSYTGRDVLAKISKELGNGKEGYWREKANEVRVKIKSYLWDEKKHACYDRDKNNEVMNILVHNNLRCMYFGSFDQQMADEFIKYHLLNPKEFWTPMPLPSIAVNDPAFRNIPENNWSGQPEGLTFQRSIRAMENYGHYAELTMLGHKFLKVIGDSMKFTQQFEPFKATIVTATQNDGYGPSILASLEFITRMYGIHLTQDLVYWSCLDDKDQYEYTQQWGNHIFMMTTRGNKVFCSVDGHEVFSFTKGIRVVSDFSGKITKVIGIEPETKKAEVYCNGKSYSVHVAPNTVYTFTSKFNKLKGVPFYTPLK
ncbi:MAG: hypothetical protein EOM73_02685 [Bacteroidia bacterium]|nr:hypothetical protein [Bacteroidia bacterium]